ncbi:long-chain-fatty-acid--CoA ligase [Niveispirillum fermenti]|uniref:long-chain-fatty-acid--CoA ligase n=1 Tax=Niveispirillum fermenti TaxID=1233113 RepID=UPI003A862D60
MHDPTLPDLIAVHAAARPAATALIFDGRRTSYAGLDQMMGRLAGALIAAGIRPGDRIAYLGKNSDAYFILLLAAARVRAMVVPLNWRMAAAELAGLMADCTPSLLFATPDFMDRAAVLAGTCPVLSTESGEVPGLWDWATRDAGASPGAPSWVDDPVLLLYTSGTTGRPKGVMLSHRNLLRVRDGVCLTEPDWFTWTPGEVALVSMPCFHIGGTGQGLRALKGGATLLVQREFEVEAILRAVGEHRVTKLFLVPSAIQSVIRHPLAAQTDFSCLRHVLYGASPIPEELLRAAMERFGCGFVQMYGMTETSGTVAALSPEDHLSPDRARLRSAGRALPGIDIAILDGNGRPLPAGTVGEIAVRSVANTAGYWQMPAETAALQADGWLRTGDAALMDDQGYLFIQDRLKDMIISGGENIYPAEVENALFGHPDVADVAVVGVPDPRWGEAVKAVIVPKPGCTPDPAGLIEWARGRIAGYKLPKSIDFAEALPRSAAGKVLRRDLRERYWAGHSRRVN